MPSLGRLLSKGYFPQDIPQPFNTASFGTVAARGGLPPEFLPNAKGKFVRHALTAKHNQARVRRLRRILGLPNPVLFFNLCHVICERWQELRTHIAKDHLTITSPQVIGSGERAIVPKTAPPDRPAIKATRRTRGRYALIADIQQFYPSVYTHSLAWALHGKLKAKKNKGDMSLTGNRLDFWVRQGQDQQTRGIPIGPDTSLVLAEILLTAVDIGLVARIGKVSGFRAIDDYELIFSTVSAAENALAEFQAVLESYDLRLNEEKTRIIELPQILDDTWPLQLRRFEIRTETKWESADLLDFFNLAFELSTMHPEASVLRYAISRVRGLSLRRSTWRLYQALFLQCANAEPGTLKHVIAELTRHKDLGCKLNHDQIGATIEQLVSRHVPLGHGSEVAWAIWLAVATKSQITKEAAKLIATTDDPLVPLLSLHANAEKLVMGGLDTTTWEDLMTPEELWGEQWLLCYEANVKRWLPSKGGKDHVRADACFGYLKTNKVTFYNVRASALKVRRWTPRVPLIEYEV